MLRSFRVANHKSIRDEQELQLMPAYDKARPVVPVSAIFGANASGKSNLIDALAWMQRAVRTSFAAWEAGSGVPRAPFRLDPTAREEPSSYVIDVVLDDVQHVYGFAVDDARITEEWFYAYPERRKRVIFERELDDVSFGSTVSDGRSRARLLESVTRPNCLALSAAAQANQDVVMPLYEWFRAQLRVAEGAARQVLAQYGAALVHRTLDRNRGLVDLLRVADLGIRDLRVTDDGLALFSRNTGVTPERLDAATVRRTKLAVELYQARSGDASDPAPVAELEKELSEADRTLRSLFQVLQQHGIGLTAGPTLVFMHGESLVPMTLDDQSDGTVGWLRLLLETMEVLASGGVLVVDEIDASLHPRLTARLIELFHDKRSNPRLAQLVFTTHDATLLGTSFGREILARDEIWFVEKDAKSGATSLLALTDFQPRREDNRVRRYLGGSYGGVPAVFSDTLVQTLVNPEAADAA